MWIKATYTHSEYIIGLLIAFLRQRLCGSDTMSRLYLHYMSCSLCQIPVMLQHLPSNKLAPIPDPPDFTASSYSSSSTSLSKYCHSIMVYRQSQHILRIQSTLCNIRSSWLSLKPQIHISLSAYLYFLQGIPRETALHNISVELPTTLMETVLSVDVCFKYVMNTRGIIRRTLSKKHSHLHQVRNLISAHLPTTKLIKRMPTYFPNEMKLALALFASQSQVPSRNFFQCVM